jgi:hypothetical protein
MIFATIRPMPGNKEDGTLGVNALRERTDRALQQRKGFVFGSLADVVVDLMRVALVKLVPGAHHTAKK